MTRSNVLFLQRTAGNRAVQQIIAARLKGASTPSPLVVQTKLIVGAAGDQYEEEADRVASQVMTAPAPAAQRQGEEDEDKLRKSPLVPSISLMAHKQGTGEREDEEVRTKSNSVSIALRETKDEEEEVRTKPAADSITSFLRRQPKEDDEELRTKRVAGPSGTLAERELDDEERRGGAGESFAASDDVEGRIAARRGSGSPLPAAAREYMEPRFGVDFGGVRVHSDAESHSLNRELNARAFTIGQDVFFGQGQYSPDGEDGRRLLAHELTHVVQQRACCARHVAQDAGSKRHLALSGRQRSPDLAVRAVHAVVLQRAVPPTSVTWTPVTLADTDAKANKTDTFTFPRVMEADPLSTDPDGFKGSEPDGKSPWWKLFQERHKVGPLYWVQGHMLNHHVHGPGDTRNLVPLSNTSNTNMEAQVEHSVKDMVLNKGKVVHYRVTAHWNLPPDKVRNDYGMKYDGTGTLNWGEQFAPSHLTWQVWEKTETPPNSGTWVDGPALKDENADSWYNTYPDY
ncbi:MAG TPA: DUF4157 domain-containing protein [Blastocatellia bacterium]|nr:DUF4157 domain-containing protein [Blastocatellia bacterium]